jgi:hypothetical protein
MDFNDDLLIDKFGLDDEWAKQPSLYNNWSVQLATAEMERDRAKENVDLVRAELDFDVRSNPSKYGLEKLTEASVGAAITQSEKYQKSVDKHLKLKYDHKIIQAAIESLNHKKYALDNLVKLYLAEYYLKDNIPIDKSAIMNELNRDTNLKKRLQRDS